MYLFHFQALNTQLTAKILSDIQRAIRQKDEEMSWADASCLQFVIRGRGSKDKPESYTFQCRDPNVKKEWIVGKHNKSLLINQHILGTFLIA